MSTSMKYLLLAIAQGRRGVSGAPSICSIHPSAPSPAHAHTPEGHIPAKMPSPPGPRGTTRILTVWAPQPGRGMQICKGDYQLCLCRVQSLNKVALTRAVQTSALILLLQIQGFSNQHPDFCSCTSAHSKHPHPIPDGAESTSLGLLHTYKLNQKQVTPSYDQRATQAHPASGMSPTGEVISRRRLSPRTELPCLCRQGSYIRDSIPILQASFVQGAEPKASETFAATRPPQKLWNTSHLPPALYCPSAVLQRCDVTAAQQRHTLQQSRRYRWSGPLLLPEEKLGSFQTRTSPP